MKYIIYLQLLAKTLSSKALIMLQHEEFDLSHAIPKTTYIHADYKNIANCTLVVQPRCFFYQFPAFFASCAASALLLNTAADAALKHQTIV
jgi:hypothetical protein